MKRLLLLLFSLPMIGLSQSAKDSLSQAFHAAETDTVRGNVALGLGYYFFTEDGDLDSALHYYQVACDQFSLKGTPLQLSRAYSGKGLIFREKGIFDKSLEAYLKSEDFARKSGDTSRITSALNGIAVVHTIQKDYPKALKYYDKCLELNLKSNNKAGLSSVYNNMGIMYSHKGDHQKSLDYYQKAMEINEELNDLRGIAIASENIGLIFSENLNEQEKAVTFFQRSLEIWRGMNDRFSTAITLYYYSSALLKMKSYQKAIDTASLSLQLARDVAGLNTQKSAHEILYKAHDAMRNIPQAYHHLKEYYALRDSLQNDEVVRQITSMQVEHELKKQKQLDSLETEMKFQLEREKKNAELDRQSSFIRFLVLGSVLLLAVLLLVYKGYQRSKRDKKEIALQKVIIEQKNHEVMDSIRYASRLQMAILPPEDKCTTLLGDHFVLFQPKDIVSGDFFWLEEWDGKIYFAVVDCTGHGVPGAMMSIVGRNGLNEALKHEGLKDPSEILSFLNGYVESALNQSVDQEVIRDGMDISLCVLDKANKELKFSGAKNSLYIFKNRELIKIAGSKRSIGRSDSADDSFNTHQLLLDGDEVIYLFSDGFQDQFGGREGKKLKSSGLNMLLKDHGHLSMVDQKQKLSDFFQTWKGDLEQVDDICVLGIRISPSLFP